MISFTAVFSKLHRLTEDGEISHRSPKILGMDEFERVAEEVEMDEDTFHDLAVLKERKDRSEYPQRTYKHLVGFKTWKPDVNFPSVAHQDVSDYGSVRELYEEVEKELEDLERTNSTGGLGFFCNIERFGIPYGRSPSQVLEFFARVSRATEPFVVWHSNQEHDFTDLYDMDREDLESEVVYRIECRDGSGEIYKVEFEHAGEEKITELQEGDA